MASLLLDTLHESRRVTHASVYLVAEDQPGFRLLDSRGPAPVSFIDASAARALLTPAADGERAVLLENVERRLMELSAEPRAAARDPSQHEELRRLQDVKAAMAQMASAITFPLMGENQVLGFWNLADDSAPEAYSSDEIAAMLEVAERAAVVIESSQLFERMKERDRLAALGEMAAGLAHEIRNPLGAIKGAAQYLRPSQLAGDDADLMQVIIDEVNRLNGVVSEFLDYSRPLRSSAQPVDVNDILEHTLRLLESQGLPESIKVDLSLDASIGPAWGDSEQLTQVFLNLALNALQAMPKGGTLTVRSGRPPPRWRFADVSDDEQQDSTAVEVRFRDTGAGIPEEAKERIFIPFYTTKEKGTGLGLAICQRIVKAHNGSITVESKPGAGTEFTVRLPGAPKEEARVRAGGHERVMESGVG
jgi:signal transduction histidine kinase